MRAFLQRLARRAGGYGEGLRPRVPALFEPAADPVEEMAVSQPAAPAPGMSPALPVPDSRAERAPAPARPAASARKSPRRPYSPVTDAASGTAQESPPVGHRPREAPGALSPPRGPGPVAPTSGREEPLPDPPAPRRAQVPAPDADPVPGRSPALSPPGAADAPRGVPRATFSRPSPVPRFGSARAALGPTRHELRPGAPEPIRSTPEPVVRVTIERLDVQAVAPVAAKRGTQRASARPDTLAEYVRRRQEAKR